MHMKHEGQKFVPKFFFLKKGMTCHNFLQVLKVIEKKINSENTVSNDGCLYQNACDYIKMNVSISKRIQTVPPVLRNSTGGDATLVTIFYKCGKLLKLYIKMNVNWTRWTPHSSNLLV